jgi:hypothetical protein
MLDAIGWLATAVFTTSYFIRQPSAMLRVQAAAAALWLAYGLAIGSMPIVVANVLVTAGALYSSFVKRGAEDRSKPAAIRLKAATDR